MRDKLSLTLLSHTSYPLGEGKEGDSVLFLRPSLKSMAMVNNPALVFAILQPTSSVSLLGMLVAVTE